MVKYILVFCFVQKILFINLTYLLFLSYLMMQQVSQIGKYTIHFIFFLQENFFLHTMHLLDKECHFQLFLPLKHACDVTFKEVGEMKMTVHFEGGKNK